MTAIMLDIVMIRKNDQLNAKFILVQRYNQHNDKRMLLGTFINSVPTYDSSTYQCTTKLNDQLVNHVADQDQIE